MCDCYKEKRLFDILLYESLGNIFTFYSDQERYYDRKEIHDKALYYDTYLSKINLQILESKILTITNNDDVNFLQYLLNSKFQLSYEFNENIKREIILFDMVHYIGHDINEYEITDEDFSKLSDYFSICSQKFPLYLSLFNKIYDDVIFNSSIDLISEYVAKSDKAPKINYNTLLVLELEEYLYHQIQLITTDLKQNPSSDFSVDSFRILLFQVMSNLSTLVLNETETRSYLEQVKSYSIKNEVNFFLLSSWLSKLTTKKSPIFNYAHNWLVQDINQRLPYFPKPLADSSSQTIEDAYFALVNRAKDLSNGNKSQIVNTTIPNILPSKSSSSPLHSFTYPKFISNKEAINDLLKHLVKFKFIAEETDIVDFRKIFNNTPLENKIVWTGNISELSYFIKQLHNEKKKVENSKQRQWEITINCFVLGDGSPLDRNKLRGLKQPASTLELDKGVNLL